MLGGDRPVLPSKLLSPGLLGAGEEEHSISRRLLANSGMPGLRSRLPLTSQWLPPRAKQKYRF